jgi:hypothetical protein
MGNLAYVMLVLVRHNYSLDYGVVCSVKVLYGYDVFNLTLEFLWLRLLVSMLTLRREIMGLQPFAKNMYNILTKAAPGRRGIRVKKLCGLSLFYRFLNSAFPLQK